MARVSFGSRAGSASDYLVGNGEFAYRQSTLNGVYGSLKELTDALRTEIEACTQSEVPELTTCELSIREDATLPLLRPAIGPYSDSGAHDLPAVFKTTWTDGSEGYPGLAATLPNAQVASILTAGEGQPRQIVQRAASRAIVQSIEATDGFKYSFNNAWAAKDDGGLRFSYICQDSMQNKDRHANGFTKTQKHLKGEGERGPRKPTYDCKGSISVKFSAVRKSVDIYYRHYAIHSSVAERRPAPRQAPRARKERVSSGREDGGQVQLRQEEDTGGLLGTLQAEHSAYTEPANMHPPPVPTEASSVGRPLKRKRDSGMGPPPPRQDPSKPLSLVDLLKQSEDARSPPPPPPASPTPAAPSYNPPPVEYSLPSWQAPPPPPPAPAHLPPQQASQGMRYQSSSNGSTYAPPYQPQQYQQQPPYPTVYGQAAPVAIPRTPSQPGPKQEYKGVPNKHARGQGLFSTLKPVRKEEYTAYEPHFVMYHSARAKTSCHNCRTSKKKVGLTASTRHPSNVR
ncbi:hypothetical protein LTR36_001759 [Oleoguttula mirabilis]|uniref:Uncharacterized protein n=1 Tax=Oleoguttula mirabilis TaxID=1507867 RepID=A0AAV9JN73_9PEZI|nr:hypothetical protein LTR36_001759 [Oleoguttula mirabilis]